MKCISDRMVTKAHTLTTMMMMIVMMMQAGPSTAFNLDLTTARVIRGANHSLFGYAVALWNEGRRNKRLVVGAPRGTNSTAANHTLPLGNVHICLALGGEEEGQDCPVHPTLPQLSDTDSSQEALYMGESMRTQGMGFGETVYTDLKTSQNRLLVCAPRYPIYNNYSRNVQPRGACYVLSSLSRHSLLVPFQDQYVFSGIKEGKAVRAYNKFDYTAYALAGFSTAFHQRQNWVFMGGPFAFRGQGVLTKGQWEDGRNPAVNKDWFDYDQSNNGNLEGWAMVVDKFDARKEWVATSLPGANDYKGKIIFTNRDLKIKPKFNVTGLEVGAWFGYCLGSGDLDGDGKAELLVGSPLAHGRHKQHYEAGKLFVYYSPASRVVPRPSPLILVGVEPWGQFGTSVACVGDLNQDGYKDVAVGAPGATGRVYIYNGGNNGLHPEPTQILEASAFSGGPPRSLGFSVSGGLDMDNNGYPDLIIGAPLSDTAVFVRTKAVVELLGGIEFDPQVLNVENKNCTVPAEGGMVACMNLLVKLHYASRNTAQNLQVELTVILDDNQRRLAFIGTEESEGRMSGNCSEESGNCSMVSGNKANFTHQLTSEEGTHTLTIPVYLKQGIYKVDLSATAFVTVRHPTFVPPSGPPPPSPAVAPVFSAFTDTSFTALARLDCTDITTCYSKPDLVLNVEGPAEVVVGEGDVEVAVVVEVRQDKAYHPQLVVMWVPGGLEFLRVKGTTTHVPVCRPRTHGHTHSLTCFLSNELDAGEKVPMTLVFSQSVMTLLTLETPDLTFQFNVTSHSRDLNIADNTYDLVIKKNTRTDLFLDGLPIPEAVSARENDSLSLEQVYNPTLRNKARLTDLGPYLAHQYTIVNHGPTPLFDVEVVVQVPSSVGGQPILYLVEPLKTSDAATCSTPLLNPLNFIIESENDEEEDEELIDPHAPPNTLEEYITLDYIDVSEDQPAMPSHSSGHQPVSPSLSTATSSSSEDEPLLYSPNHSLENDPQRGRREAALPSPSTQAQANSYPTPSSTSPASPSTSPTSSSLSTTPSSATSTPTSPTPISSVSPETEEEEEEEDGTQSVITIDCDQMACEEIWCLVPSLAPGESVTLEVGGYLVVASIKYRYRYHLKRKQRSISLTSTATLLTEGPCVFINGEGTRGPHCAGNAQETDKQIGKYERIGIDEQVGADNGTGMDERVGKYISNGTDEQTDVENLGTEDDQSDRDDETIEESEAEKVNATEGRHEAELMKEASNVNPSHMLKLQVSDGNSKASNDSLGFNQDNELANDELMTSESVLSTTYHSIQAENGGTINASIDSTTLNEDHSETETTTVFDSTATQSGFQDNFDAVATRDSDFGKNTETTTDFDNVTSQESIQDAYNTSADYDSISTFKGDQDDNSTETTTDLDSTSTYDHDDNGTEPTTDSDIEQANSTRDSVPKTVTKGGPRSGDIMDRGRPQSSVTVATSITIIKNTDKRDANIWDVAPWKLFSAILVGTMIIIIIIAICHKTGFFKRKKRISVEQRQELRRNQQRRSRAQSYQSVAYNTGGVVMVG